MKRFAILVLAGLLLVSAAAGALEVREGRLKLVLDEKIGRFSLFYMTDIEKGRYEPLFFSQDPRTSFLSVMVDDRAFKLGESTSFKTSAERSGGGARFVFRSSSLTVVEEFSFLTSSGSSLADAVRIDVSVTNQSERDMRCGVRMVIDTNLGEKSSQPFATDLRGISSETSIVQGDKDSRWTSSGESYGVMGSLKLPGVPTPDEVVFANWKRLNDTAWRIDASPGRNFNLLPYSIGDSAVAYYFDPTPLPRGVTRTVSVALGLAVPGGFALASPKGGSDTASELLKASVSAAATPALALRTDLISVRDLVARIDEVLSAGGAISDDELTALRTVLQRLEEREKSY